MRAALLSSAMLAACASGSQTDYDQRMNCLATVEVTGMAMRVAGTDTPTSRAQETALKATIARGAIAAGEAAGKTPFQIEGEFKAAVRAKANALKGESDNASRDAIIDLGNNALRCIETYQQQKS